MIVTELDVGTWADPRERERIVSIVKQFIIINSKRRHRLRPSWRETASDSDAARQVPGGRRADRRRIAPVLDLP